MFAAMALAKAGSKKAQENPLTKLFDAVELFMASAGDMSAVFNGYPGSDYCAGLNFGYNGAYFLTRFVSTVNALKDLKEDSIPNPLSSDKTKKELEDMMRKQRQSRKKSQF